ncbi:MAG: response regulator [Phormidesmis sp.]
MKGFDKLLEKLEQLSDGELHVLSKFGKWQFHILDGQLIYASSETLAVRRFRRAVQAHRPGWEWFVSPQWCSEKRPWEILLIEWALVHAQLSTIQVKLILRMVLQECLFELMYDPEAESEWHPYHMEASSAYRSAALSISEVRRVWHKTQSLYQNWQDNWLGDLRLSASPVLSPEISSSEADQENAAQSLLADWPPTSKRYLKGDAELWDLLQNVEPSLPKLSKRLLSMIKAEAIEFREIEDLPLPIDDLAAQNLATQNPAAQSSTTRLQRPADTVVSSSSQRMPLDTTRRAASALVASTSSESSQPKLVACIDDSPVLTQLLKKILTSAGYRTLSIPEPMRGFSKLIEHRPDLILLDLMLPNADGYSICKFLRETPAFEKTPIIILTGQDSNLDRLRARLAGATEFLTKPPQAEMLLEMIKSLLGPDEREEN